MIVYPDGVMYGGVKAEDVPEIISEHLVGGKPVERLKVPAMRQEWLGENHSEGFSFENETRMAGGLGVEPR